MNTRAIKLSRIALLLGIAGIVPVHSAQATLLGVVKTGGASDTTLSTNVVSYDKTGVDANTGLLTVYSTASVLLHGLGPTTDLTQNYTGSGDTVKDLMLTFQIANGTGILAAGTFEGGSVSIFQGTRATNTQKWSWSGNITAFGFDLAGGDFDATWNVTGESYVGISSLNLLGGSGGLTIGSTGGSAAGFNSSWTLNPGALVDVFATPVPEVDSVWFMAIGLAVLAPVVRRRKAM